MGYLTVGDLAKRYNANPRDITHLFYTRRLDGSRCPIIGGRRLIPVDYAEVVAHKLRELGLLETIHAQ
jgi:hypothetical protein